MYNVSPNLFVLHGAPERQLEMLAADDILPKQREKREPHHLETIKKLSLELGLGVSLDESHIDTVYTSHNNSLKMKNKVRRK